MNYTTMNYGCGSGLTTTTVNITGGNVPTYVYNSGWNSSGLWSSTQPSMTMTPSGTISLTGEIIINGERVNLSKIHKEFQEIKERLLMIEPDFKMHEKYPALKSAYEQYMLVLKMCEGEDDES